MKTDQKVVNGWNIWQLLRAGDRSTAVALYQEHAKTTLEEAEKAISYLSSIIEEDHLRYQNIDWEVACSDEFLSYLDRGWRLNALKLYMDRTGVHLKEAIDDLIDIKRERNHRCDE